MLDRLLAPVRAAAARAARKAAFGAVGVIFLLAGLAFLTAAAWIALAIAYGALIAALVIGLAFTGCGLIFLAVATSSSKSGKSHPPQHLHQEKRPPAAVSQAQLIDAFIGGLNAGKTMRRR
ncbi:phage holin family protein [Oceaniglobus trochenteri]|uniref:phage holin family protein n=1 Tax=Oceaniglobus trochenteri TaxID=2763260 RepID=UPI001CFFB2E7|nr:phage holin family protein [Oceaniglobus trochenteri]